MQVERDEKGRVKPGFTANPRGRAKGARSKLNERFLRDFLGAWEQNGAAALNEVAQNDPSTFVRVAASILPKHVEHRHGLMDELQQLPIDEMKRRLAEIRAREDESRVEH